MKYYITSQSDSEAFSIPKNGSWLKFFETIFAAGHEIVPLEECPDIIVFMNNHPNLLKRVARVNKTAIKILVLWEPKVTRACNFSENNSRDFDFISHRVQDGSQVTTWNISHGLRALEKIGSQIG